MRLASLPLIALVLIALPTVAATKPRPKRVAAHGKAKPTASRPIAMDSDRATQIQTALIREGYLTGAPSGTWDTESAAAMQKMQSDNGWQTKIVPDSRALIKLGLGPQQTVSN